jgi:hypothetical protein
MTSLLSVRDFVFYVVLAGKARRWAGENREAEYSSEQFQNEIALRSSAEGKILAKSRKPGIFLFSAYSGP